MDTDVMRMRSLGRKVKRSMANGDSDTLVKRRIGTLHSVSGNRATVNFGNTASPLMLEGVRFVKSCTGMKAGDQVIVDTVGHIAIITAVLA